jgi:integrase
VSAAFRRGKRGYVSIYVPTRTGLVQRSCGTAEKVVVSAMKRLVRQLKDERRWILLDAIRDKRLTLPALFDRRTDLAALEAEMRAVNLVHHLDPWERWVRARTGGTVTAAQYRTKVETLVAGVFLSSEMTRPRVKAWLAGLPVSSGTRRNYLTALQSFLRYCVDAGLYEVSPIAGMEGPKGNDARTRYEPLAVQQSIAAAAPAPFRALFSLIAATGAEVSAALGVTLRDLDLERGVVLLRGTKSARRHREAVIEAWALPVLRAHCAGLLPAAPLFPGITRQRAYHVHLAACEAVGVQGYTVHDARHSLAVRWRRRVPPASWEEIAAQLGNTPWETANTYARFDLTGDERLASVRQAERPAEPQTTTRTAT